MSIRAEGLARRFGAVQAVEEVSFFAPDGAITGLLGPNGAGKTTTLRMIAGLLRPDLGRALIDEHSSSDAPDAARRALGILPEGRGLYDRLTARENIRYFGALQGLAAEQIEARIDALIPELELEDFIDRRTDGFSQGQRVRVAIARALVHRPQNLILDEPTNGLDVMSTRGLRRVLERLRERGACIVLSTHIMQEVAALTDKIVIIARGQVIADATPDTLRADARTDDLEDAFVKLLGSDEGLGA